MKQSIEQPRVTWVRRACVTKGIKVYEPMELLKDSIDKFKKPCLGWSGGKCSTAVLHMALQIDPHIQVLFIDTGVEFPESYAYIKKMALLWNLNLKTYKPTTTFWAVAEKYGFPQFRTITMDQNPNHKRPRQPKCCLELKEKTLHRATKEIGMDLNITGIRLAESRARTFLISGKGQFYYVKSNNYWNCHPIAFWTINELNKYFEDNDIPVSGLYAKGQERTGCWPCTGFKTWAESLAKSHPKMYDFVSHKIGRQLMTDYLEADPVFVTPDVEGCPDLANGDSN